MLSDLQSDIDSALDESIERLKTQLLTSPHNQIDIDRGKALGLLQAREIVEAVFEKHRNPLKG